MLLQASKLASFEIVKAVHLDPVAWTDKTLLTPTFKLKRVDAKRAYQVRLSVYRVFQEIKVNV